MLIQLEGSRIVVTAPAKVNLFLEIVAKLPSGFHEIDTLICPINWCDKLIFEEKKDSDIRFRVELPSKRKSADAAWDIPSDHSNLVLRAVELVRERLGIKTGCEISLVKQVPANAGLGGGSSNAAAAIVAGLVSWGEWNRSVAGSIAAELGSDVNFFLGDEQIGIGLARCTGRGELTTVLPWRPQLNMMVCHPPKGCSTREVYAQSRVAPRPRNAASMVKACQSANIDEVGRELFNALQEPATQVTEWIPQQIEYLRRIGARFCLMTGSGSACFALTRNQQDAEEMACQMRSLGLPRACAVKSWYARPIEMQLNDMIATHQITEPA